MINVQLIDSKTPAFRVSYQPLARLQGEGALRQVGVYGCSRDIARRNFLSAIKSLKEQKP